MQEYFKNLEKNFSYENPIKGLPLIIRLDGVGFSKYTKTLTKPFDSKFNESMDATLKHLMQFIQADIGYTQSDEITLILYPQSSSSMLWSGGKKSKVLSKLASECSLEFTKHMGKPAVFDCRQFQTPNLKEAVDVLLWRQMDCVRNAVQNKAYYVFGHKQTLNKSVREMTSMLEEANQSMKLESDRNRLGTFARFVRVETPYTQEELRELPQKHNAHKNPDLVVSRRVLLTESYMLASQLRFMTYDKWFRYDSLMPKPYESVRVLTEKAREYGVEWSDIRVEVSFDFDKTLTQKSVQEYFVGLRMLGIKCWIVTARYCDMLAHNWVSEPSNKDMYDVLDGLGVSYSDVVFCNMGEKHKVLTNSKALWHLDDYPQELKDLPRNGFPNAVDSLSNDWKSKCDMLLISALGKKR